MAQKINFIEKYFKPKEKHHEPESKIFSLSQAKVNEDVILQVTELGLTVTYIKPGHYEKLEFDKPIDAIIPEALEGVTADGVSYSYRGIKHAVIPEGVSKINDYAFSGCKSLESINIPEGVTEIGDSAFYECESLGSVNLPDSVTEIGIAAFHGCTSLGSVNLPDSVTEIGRSAFRGCTSLESINIPTRSIWKSTFKGCPNLKDVHLEHAIEVMDSETRRWGYYEFEERIFRVPFPEAFLASSSLTVHVPPHCAGILRKECEKTSIKINIDNPHTTKVDDYANESVNTPNDASEIGESNASKYKQNDSGLDL